METQNDWTFQLSVKIDGEHMLNVRAVNAVDFWTNLKMAVENAELLQTASRALEGVKKPVHSSPASAPRFASGGPAKAPGAEVGPVTVLGVDKASTKRDGTPMKSPKYTVRFSDRKFYSTFEKLVADAAEGLQGQNVYYTTEKSKDGQFENLASVRSAGA